MTLQRVGHLATFDTISPGDLIGRVRWIAPGARRLYVDLQNGQTVTADGDALSEFRIGQVVLVNHDSNFIVAAPDELWPEPLWVGVVRVKHDDKTVVDTNGRWKTVPTHSQVNYKIGNTVEACDSAGVVRVLSNDPIRYLDLPEVDATVVSRFRAGKDTNETFDDFGGLGRVVERAKELIEVPLTHKKRLSEIGARPVKGILFTGPPGTGKTMLARIIANCTEAEFYEISGPEIFSKWYGQSEELLRKIFEDAATQERAIIFFDEIDSVASQRQDESHEASRRVVAQLLTLMDGFTRDTNIVVIAATNRPQDIDAALRRPGRLDWEIDFPLPSRADRHAILETSSRRLATSGILPHEWMAQKTEGWSAAELAAIWSEAALLAVKDGRAAIMSEDYVGGLERVSQQRHRVTLTSRETPENELS